MGNQCIINEINDIIEYWPMSILPITLPIDYSLISYVWLLIVGISPKYIMLLIFERASVDECLIVWS